MTCLQVAEDKACSRMVWQCLDWNTKAMDLYKKVGGKCLHELLMIRMSRPDIHKFVDTHET